MIIEGYPKSINRNRQILGRRRKSKSAIQVVESGQVIGNLLPVVWSGPTTDATATELYLQGNDGERYEYPEDGGIVMLATINCKEEESEAMKTWSYRATFNRNGTGNITIDIAIPETLVFDATLSTVVFEFKVDNTDYYIYPEVTGAAGKNLNWKIVSQINEI